MGAYVEVPKSDVLWQFSESELRDRLTALDEEAAPGIFDVLRGLTGQDFVAAYERYTNPKWEKVECCRRDYNEAMGRKTQ